MTRHLKELLRYVINGLVATAVHYSVLTFNLEVVQLDSAGVANLIAAVFGIAVSFLGSRYFVFRDTRQSFCRQALAFSGLYGAIALLHGAVLYFWSDVAGLDYRVGFLFATGLQVMMSYLGNKFLVFQT